MSRFHFIALGMLFGLGLASPLPAAPVGPSVSLPRQVTLNPPTGEGGYSGVEPQEGWAKFLREQEDESDPQMQKVY
jgi:hypothetical protein